MASDTLELAASPTCNQDQTPHLAVGCTDSWPRSGHRKLKSLKERAIALLRIIEHFVVGHEFDVAACILVVQKVALVIGHPREIPVLCNRSHARREATQDVGVEG